MCIVNLLLIVDYDNQFDFLLCLYVKSLILALSDIGFVQSPEKYRKIG